MPTLAESTAHFDRLEAQAQLLTAVFRAGGYELVAPAIIQPAGLMLDVVGEDLRARTYVFADQDGNELCLRPDLTVPTCRLYLERNPAADAAARLCYNGPAFRYRPLDAKKGNPREFRQAGLEQFGVSDKEVADAEIVALTTTAVRSAGLRAMNLKLGDLSLVAALLDALAMPQRWRDRLRQLFWRPQAFRAELQRLTDAPDAAARRLPTDLVRALDPGKPDAAVDVVAAFLTREAIDLQGTRTLDDITQGLLAIVADARTPALAQRDAALIEALVAVRATAVTATDRIAAAIKRPGVDLSTALDAFQRRLDLMRAGGADLDGAQFSGEFGRKFEYYTGFVFELEAPGLGRDNPVAGGGRYDSLLAAVGAPRVVPAVGAAIYTERLLQAQVGWQAGSDVQVRP
jgi:ATP phosphoribosyltransferase regulatory subunit